MKLVTTEGRDWTSSLISYTEYNPDDKQLLIVFTNKQQYLYTEVTVEEYQAFYQAESKGSFFSKNFRTKKFTKLETNTTTDGNPQS